MYAPHSLTHVRQMRFFAARSYKHEHRSCMLIAGCRWVVLGRSPPNWRVSIRRPYFYFLCSLGADASFVMTESGNKSGVVAHSADLGGSALHFARAN
jgi:hypothetical protein